MKCPLGFGENAGAENAELLLDYCARRLDPERTAILDAHMSVCEACRRLRDGQQALWASLDQWEAAEVSADFDRRLYRRIEAEESGLRWWQRVFVRPAIPLTATAGLALAVGFLLHHPANSPVSPDPVPAAADVEQVERTLEDLDMLRQLNLVRAGVEESAPVPRM